MSTKIASVTAFMTMVAATACLGEGARPDRGERVGSGASRLTTEDCALGTAGGKDTICHRTASGSHAMISVATQACVHAHAGHAGDFLASAELGCACVPHGASCSGVDVGCCNGET